MRASCKNNIKPWFTLFRKVVETNSIPLDLIINLDETPLRFVTKPSLVVMPSSSPIQPIIPTPSRALNATVTLAVGMKGKSFPTQLLWPSKRIPNDFDLLTKPDVIIDANGSGWQTEKTFRDYMINTLLPSIIDYRNTVYNSSTPILIILDGHSSRASVPVLEFCNQNNIIILCFPSHVSHLIQPCDRGLNKLLKDRLKFYYDESHNPFVVFYIK